MGGDLEFVCDYWYENVAQYVFLSFLRVVGAGQLQNLLFSKLIASWVELRAETGLITFSPTSWR